MTSLNLYTWFNSRELEFCPAHFIVVNTTLTLASKNWIREKINGRFCFVTRVSDYMVFESFPAFEDPKDATYFQLIWT